MKSKSSPLVFILIVILCVAGYFYYKYYIDSIGSFISKVENTADEMCACKTMSCKQQTMAKMKDIEKEAKALERKHGGEPDLSDSQKKRLVGAMARLMQCAFSR